jgi:hypothetical protein
MMMEVTMDKQWWKTIYGPPEGTPVDENDIDPSELLDMGGEICPICCNLTLFRNGRCVICKACGHSMCEI